MHMHAVTCSRPASSGGAGSSAKRPESAAAQVAAAAAARAGQPAGPQRPRQSLMGGTGAPPRAWVGSGLGSAGSLCAGRLASRLGRQAAAGACAAAASSAAPAASATCAAPRGVGPRCRACASWAHAPARAPRRVSPARGIRPTGCGAGDGAGARGPGPRWQPCLCRWAPPLSLQPVGRQWCSGSHQVGRQTSRAGCTSPRIPEERCAPPCASWSGGHGKGGAPCPPGVQRPGSRQGHASPRARGRRRRAARPTARAAARRSAARARPAPAPAWPARAARPRAARRRRPPPAPPAHPRPGRARCRHACRVYGAPGSAPQERLETGTSQPQAALWGAARQARAVVPACAAQQRGGRDGGAPGRRAAPRRARAGRPPGRPGCAAAPAARVAAALPSPPARAERGFAPQPYR